VRLSFGFNLWPGACYMEKGIKVHCITLHRKRHAVSKDYRVPSRLVLAQPYEAPQHLEQPGPTLRRIEHLGMVDALEPQDLEPVGRPALARRILAREITVDGARVDDLVAPRERYGRGAAREVLAEQHALVPVEVAAERARDVRVARGEEPQLPLVGRARRAVAEVVRDGGVVQHERDRVDEQRAGDARRERGVVQQEGRERRAVRVRGDDEARDVVRGEDVRDRREERGARRQRRGHARGDGQQLEREDADVRVLRDERAQEGEVGPEADLRARALEVAREGGVGGGGLTPMPCRKRMGSLSSERCGRYQYEMSGSTDLEETRVRSGRVGKTGNHFATL
jgi:hypothetical protein